ncbi:MAG: TonB-dependent receptor [Rhizobacter sp.]|nr:TonB-dependent receptor [Ferruginibacter sp.]
MMTFVKHIFFYSFFFFLSFPVLFAQTDSAVISTLDSITIQAYQGKNLLQTPAAVNYISSKELSRFSNTNILQALNATPGVRMEERSPGSYRLNIRGSSVRSAFGVRNVKIYYAGIPFTSPGGASMLNMMGYYNVASLEVVKGPGGSVYGAGTGGVLLINPVRSGQQKLTAGFMAGSFGLAGAHTAVSFNNHIIGYEHLQAKGYRNHTAMRRDNVSWDAVLQSSSKNKLETHLLYSNLFYETPGALTLNEFSSNPKAARPASPAFPGAEQAKASIHQQNLLLGLSNRYSITTGISNTTTLYGFHSYTKNPTVQNYERKTEPHFGGRTIFDASWKKSLSLFEVNAGLEFQRGNFNYKTYKNVAGKPDSLQIKDELNVTNYFSFAQLNWNYKHWIVSAGGSVSNMRLNFNRLSQQPNISEQKKYTGEFTPRFALMFKINKTISAFVNFAKGFSPPAADEIFADNNSYNLALEPEKSWNYEPGIRGNILNKKLTFDLSYFTTKLSNSIVTRRDSGGGNYFVNTGKTKQHGFEGSLGYGLFQKASCFLHGSNIRLTYSHYNFRYTEFVQSGNSFSGNKMPGVSPNNVNVLADIETKKNIYLNISYSYTDKVELNDANSAAARSYYLLSAKLGYKKQIKKMRLSFFAGADNIGDVRYSLGNDINGFGGRYYNVAPGRAFYGGAGISF